MGMVSCNSCGRSVSEQAASCPFCGQPKPGLNGFAKLADSMGVKQPSSYAGMNPDLVGFMRQKGIWN